MNTKVDEIRIKELGKLSTDYRIMEGFIKKCNRVNYIEFDYHVVNHMTLFTIEPEFDFDILEEIIDRIIKTLPAIKNIFAKPLLHLKQEDEILPVESVRVINNDTIVHISGHSELWDDVKNGEIQPLKLLTKTYKDNYGIYENLVFCKAVDDILSFTRTNIRFLKDLIFTNQTIEVNLLERVNHLNYFLSLGKLHTGYIRNFDKYYAVSQRCLKKLNFIYNTIVPRLKSPVYKNNKNRPKKLRLHKTNILSMHRDYHQIYALLKYFSNHQIESDVVVEEKDILELKENYFYFCLILSIFSIGHFNFTCNEEETLHLKKLNATFKFKKWELNISTATVSKTKIILLEFSKDSLYRVILIPSISKENKELVNQIKAKYAASEYIICTPYEDDSEDCFLSISNVESFRRVQQILLRGMAYSDNKRKDCPFCNNKLVYNLDSSRQNYEVYECGSCRLEVIDTVCDKLQKPYTMTRIAYLSNSSLEEEQYSKDEQWIYRRKVEAQMHYRNITKMSHAMDMICPHCHKIHKG